MSQNDQYRNCQELVEWLSSQKCPLFVTEKLREYGCDEWTLLITDETILADELKLNKLQIRGLLQLIKPNTPSEKSSSGGVSNEINNAPNNPTSTFESKYEKVSILGRGSFGIVYQVKLKQKQNIVRAVKVVSDSINFGVNEALEEVLQTMKVAHEHVIKIYGATISKSDYSLMIEMECLENGSLFDYFVKRGIKPSERMIISIIRQIISALEYMKRKLNMVHRDIKLGNILIRNIDMDKDEIDVCLADFGFARSFGENSQISDIYGTFSYLAPEIKSWDSAITSKQPYSIASDIYALGVTLFNLMTGSKFTGNNQSMLNNVKYEKSLVELVLVMLSNNPRDRDLNSIKLKEGLEEISTLEKFKDLLEKGIEGDVNAQLKLGSMYEFGEGISKSHEKAFEWYQKAAIQGNASAQFDLGWMYKNGIGVSQSNEMALEWFQQSANQKDEKAQHNLGLMHFEGVGVSQSYEKALEWFQLAANRGHVNAQYYVGLMNFEGKGTLQSIEKAFVWFQQSAFKGHSTSQYYLGQLYKHGKGTKQSSEKAFIWTQISAVQGHSDAQFNLGVMYENGEGVQQSKEKALEWYKKSKIKRK